MSKKEKILIIGLVSCLMIVIVSISYSYFVATVSGGSTTVGGTSTSTFDATLNTEADGYINATNMIPVSGHDFGSKAYFTVTTGDNKYPITYTLSLTSLSISSNLQVSDFKWILICTNDSSKSTSGTFSGVSSSAYTLKTNISLDPNSTDTYELRIWIQDDGTQQSELMNGTFSGKITMNANMVYIPLLTDKILGAAKANVSATLTTPGQSLSASNEAVLASTTDDYGTSYYYRGAVTNNYVVFANMCWRIVRITGNGATKLVLYNYNPNSVSNPCDTAQDGTTYAFARYTGTTYSSIYNAYANYNAYIGLMYGNSGSSTYAAEQANTTKNVLLTNLETWYTSKLSSYSSYLADTIWCNDKSMSTASTYLGYGNNVTYYKAYQRMSPAASSSPSLVCPNDSNGGKLSKFTVDDTTNGNGDLTYKIGLLTADEVAFAGGNFQGGESSTTFLTNNATGWWWTSSPSSCNTTIGILSVYNGILSNYGGSNTAGVRPAISLVSTTMVTGSGTSSDPYIVVGY